MGCGHINSGTWQWEYIYKVLVEQAGDGLYMIGIHTGKILFSNQAFASMFGFTTEELEGTCIEDIYLPEDRRRMKSVLRRVIRGEKVVEEFWSETRSGEWICIEMKPGLIELAGNQFVACVARDITRRKRTEQALRNSEKRFRDLYEHAPTAYFSSDMKGRIKLANRAAECLLGYARDSLTDRSVIDLYADTPSGKEKAQRLNQRILAGEEICDEELEMRRFDGSSIWINLTVRLIHDEGGRLVERRAMVVDITAHKRAEKEVQWLAEIGLIINSSLDIKMVYEQFAEEVRKLIPFDRISITSVDTQDGTLTHRYVSGVVIPGWGPGEAQPLPGSTTEMVMQTRTGLLIGEGNVEEMINRFPGLGIEFSGRLRSMVAVPLISNNEANGTLQFRSKSPNAYSESDLALAERVGAQIAGAIGNAQLYAERELAEEALRESERRVRQLATASVRAHEEERQWIALEVHDRISQSLVSVFHQLQKLQYMTRADPSVQPVVQRSSALLQDAIRESQNIMNDLYPAGLDEFGVVPLMEAELSRFQEDTGCRVSFNADAEVMPSQEVGVTLYRIFHEALANIQRHAPGTQNVVVSLTYREMFINLEVQDDGPGFDMEAVTEDNRIGGLMSMQRRAEIIGGSFEVTSKPGEGAIVSICVPIESA